MTPATDSRTIAEVCNGIASRIENIWLDMGALSDKVSSQADQASFEKAKYRLEDFSHFIAQIMSRARR